MKNITTPFSSFGMLKPNRNTQAVSYRYGFNGQEKDNEIYGNSNAYTAAFWEYDPRLGRRWNVDPKPNPSISNYAAFANNPIWYSDAKGDTVLINLFNKDDVSWQAAQNMVKDKDINDGVFIIAGHANALFVQDQSTYGKLTDLYAKDLGKLLLDKGLVDAVLVYGEAKVILAGCNTATTPTELFGDNPKYKDKKSVAQELSEYSDKLTVEGAYGYTEPRNKLEEKPATKGHWKIFKGGKEVDKRVPKGQKKPAPTNSTPSKHKRKK